MSIQSFLTLRMRVSRKIIVNDQGQIINHQRPSIFDMNGDTIKIYREKQHVSSFRRCLVINKLDGMNGKTPDYSYQLLFSIKRILNANSHPTFAIRNQSNYIGIQHSPYVSLHKGHQDYILSEIPIKTEDVIRMGNLYFKVIKTHQDNRLPLFSLKNIERADNLERDGRNQQVRQCRVCLSNQDPHEIITPCDCKGSCSNIHFSCLKTWMKSKCQYHIASTIKAAVITKFQCQICKKQLKNQYQINGIPQFLIDYGEFISPYIVLQRINSLQNQKLILTLHPSQVPITIGSGLASAVRFPISNLSLVHASITFKNNSFYLRSQDQLNGTFVQVNQHLQIINNMEISWGDTNFTFYNAVRNNTNYLFR